VEGSVIIVEYDPKWPVIYEQEKAKILGVIGSKVVAIEHVGSTAVSGLGAKPIIDIMVGVADLSDAKECIEPLRSIGYEYVPEYEASMPERRYFRKGPRVPNQHFHLHMVEYKSDFWTRHLLFRNYLRTHAKTAQQYYQLKKKLAGKHGADREGYTEAKTAFIQSVVTKARKANQESTSKTAISPRTL